MIKIDIIMALISELILRNESDIPLIVKIDNT